MAPLMPSTVRVGPADPATERSLTGSRISDVAVLRHEGSEMVVRDPEDQDRLIMLDQMGSDDTALQIEPDRDIHRLGRVAGTVHDVGAEEGVTRNRAVSVGRIHRQLRHPFTEAVRVGKDKRQLAPG